MLASPQRFYHLKVLPRAGDGSRSGGVRVGVGVRVRRACWANWLKRVSSPSWGPDCEVVGPGDAALSGLPEEFGVWVFGEFVEADVAAVYSHGLRMS